MNARISRMRISVATRRRVAMWTIAALIELGYAIANTLSATRPPWWPFSIVFALALASGILCSLGKRHGCDLFWVRSARSTAAVCFMTACIGYGFCQEASAPSSVRGWLGHTLTATGQVTGAFAGKTWRYYRIHLSSVQFDTVNGVGPGHVVVHACRIDVDFRGGSVHGGSPLQVGDQVLLRGMIVQASPSASSGSGQSTAQGYALLGHVLTVHSTPDGLPNRIRQRLLVELKTVTDPTSVDATLMESIVFGGTQVDKSTTQNFQRAGLLHILAASGANVLLLTQSAEWVIRPLFVRLRMPHQVWNAWLLLCVWGFAAMCQMAPSIERAALMTSYRLVGTMVGRQPTLSTATAVAGAFMSVAMPATLSSSSALMSFAATIAVARAVAGHRVRRSGWRHPWTVVVHHLAASIRITIWVELYVTPLTVTLFQQWTPFSVIANAGAEPLMVMLLPLTAAVFVLVAAAALSPFIVTLWMARGMAVPTLDVLHLLTAWASLVASWPRSMITLQSPSVGWIIAYYAVLLFSPGAARWGWRQWRIRQKPKSQE